MNRSQCPISPSALYLANIQRLQEQLHQRLVLDETKEELQEMLHSHTEYQLQDPPFNL